MIMSLQEIKKMTDSQLQVKIKYLAGAEKKLEFEFMKHGQVIFERKIHLTLGYSSLPDYMKKHLKLSKDVAIKRSRAVNVITYFPEFLPLLEMEMTHVSHLSAVARKITKANKDKILEFLPNQSKRKLDLFLSTLNADGSHSSALPTISITMKLTEDTVKLYDLARSLISKDWHGVDHEDVMKRLLNEFLDRKDPQRRAERMAKKKDKKESPTKTSEKKPEDEKLRQVDESIVVETSSGPGAIKNNRYITRELDRAVRLRDGGRCIYEHNGKRCERTTDLEIHHLHMYCRGGSNEVSNLSLVCSSHNRLLSEMELGKTYYPNLN